MDTEIEIEFVFLHMKNMYRSCDVNPQLRKYTENVKELWKLFYNRRNDSTEKMVNQTEIRDYFVRVTVLLFPRFNKRKKTRDMFQRFYKQIKLKAD